VSSNAVAQQPTKMGFRAGTLVTVDNALKMLMVKSANDMAVTLAEGVSGSIEKFADAMNAESQRLGMTQSSWVNPNGLPAESQITSARDMAILARAIIREFPEYDFYWHIPAIRLGKRVMRNYNTLIDRYPGADGMKTGFICASGFNLVASATRGNRRLIAVVLGAHSSPVRAVKTAQLFEHGFNGNTLSWLLPSLGTVESLVPVNATPPNLRDEMCGKHRKRPAAEEVDEEDDATPVANGDSSSPQAFMLSSLRGSSPKPSSLIGPLVESAPPITVFVGAPKQAGEAPPRRAKAAKPAVAAVTPKTGATGTAAAASDTSTKPAASKPAKKVAAKPVAAKTDAVRPVAAKPTTPKPTTPKPVAAKPVADKPATQ
jgi:D-alanyl-D-alanine carboxypeptidase